MNNTENIKEDLEKKLLQFIKHLGKHSLVSEDVGVLSGLGGIILFYFYAGKYFKNNALFDKGFQLLEEAICSIQETEQPITFCSGLASFGWVIEHLEKNGFISADKNNILSELDLLIYKSMGQDLLDNNIDYLHGAIGKGLYLMERDNPIAKQEIAYLVEKIYDLGIKDDEGMLKWESYKYINHSYHKIYNLGLAHGIAGIIFFLAKALKNEIHSHLASKMLYKSIAYLRAQQLNINKQLSYFPAWINNDSKERSSSRLAWCYGDLGIGNSIYEAAKTIHSEDALKFSLDIMKHSTWRTDPADTMVNDAGICHGSAGIAHIFNRMYRNTNDEHFLHASEYWFRYTLKLAHHNNGIGGYKFYINALGGWVNETNLLTGISGVGLSMLSFLSNDTLKWDECLLLS